MAEIFSVTLPDGSQYDLEDQVARDFINEVAFKEDTTYGPSDIVSFNSNISKPVKNLKVNIEPIQDLHGYANPWPAGGGKNLLPLTVVGIKEANTNWTWNDKVGTKNGVTCTIQTDDSENVVGININTSSSATANTYLNIHLNMTFPVKNYVLNGMTGGSSTFNQYMYDSTAGTNGNVDTGSGANFTPIEGHEYRDAVFISNGATVSNIVVKPMIRLASISDATFAPYSNICPISGWTGCNVTRTGKNLLSVTLSKIKELNTTGTWNDNVYARAGITMTVNVDENSNTVTGIKIENQATGNMVLPIADIKLDAGTEYVLSGCPSGGSTATSGYRLGLSLNGSAVLSDVGNGTTFTPNSSATYEVRIRIPGNVSVNLLYKPMIRLSSDSDATYIPYLGTTLPISWQSEAGTVYGGTLDVTSGVLTVTKLLKTFNGTETWTKSTSTSVDRYLAAYGSEPGSNLVGSSICNMYVQAPLGNADINSFYIDNGSGQYRVAINYARAGTTTAEDFKEFVANNNIQLVVTLITPIVIQLDPVTVTALLGQNNIWADCGQIILTDGSVLSSIQTQLSAFSNYFSSLHS